MGDFRNQIQALNNEITKRLENEPEDAYFPELEESLRPKVEVMNALMNDYNYALKMRYLISQLYLLHHRIAQQDFNQTVINYSKSLQVNTTAVNKAGFVQLDLISHEIEQYKQATESDLGRLGKIREQDLMILLKQLLTF